MADLVVHFEIHASDPQRLIDYYSELLGWTFTNYGGGDQPYWVIDTGEGSIRNAAGQEQPHRRMTDRPVRQHVHDPPDRAGLVAALAVLVPAPAVRSAARIERDGVMRASNDSGHRPQPHHGSGIRDASLVGGADPGELAEAPAVYGPVLEPRARVLHARDELGGASDHRLGRRGAPIPAHRLTTATAPDVVAPAEHVPGRPDGARLAACDPSLGRADDWHLHEWSAAPGYRAALAWHPRGAAWRPAIMAR